MNILGFVSAILIIFSIISSFMLKQHVDDSVISKSMKGYYIADMESKNAYEEFVFSSQEKIASSPTDKTKNTAPKDIFSQGLTSNQIDEKTKKEVVEKEKTQKIYACSSLNIFPLIKNDKTEEKELYDLFTKLVKLLYQKEMPKEKMENAVVDALIASCKKKLQDKEEICLEKINLKNPSLQSLWYKMLKGTKGYDFEKKIGFPSILSFITLEEKDSPNKICIATSTKEMLTALFNKKIADKIWEKRKKTKIVITKQELQTILDESLTANELAPNIWSHIVLSHQNHKKNPRLTICKDNATEIAIQRVCRYQ